MTIAYIAPAAAGNAVQIMLDPPAGARRWRVLRKRANTIATADDPGANVIHDGDDKSLIDQYMLTNGTEYFYRVFYLSGTTWTAAPSRACTPRADYADLAPDVVDIVRDRVDLGLATFVEKRVIVHPDGHMPVLMATPAFDDTVFPIATVHLTSNPPSDRFIGEVLGPDTEYDDGTVGVATGWLSRYQISIICWSTNGDTRTLLRKILRAVVQANLPIFAEAGLDLIEPDFADNDDVSTYPVPVYQTICTLSCIAPTAIESRVSAIASIDVDVDFN